MALFKKAGIVSDLLTSNKNSVEALTGKPRPGATMAVPSDSLYYRNPYEKNQNLVMRYKDENNTYFDDDEPSSYQQAYNNAYNALMNKSFQSGKMLTDPFYEVEPSKVYSRLPNGQLLVTNSRNRGLNDAVKAYQKDVKNMNLFDANSLLKYGSGGKFAAADTVNMTAKDRAIVEKGLAIARQIQAAKDEKAKAKKNKKK
jgi:hypothetical protein